MNSLHNNPQPNKSNHMYLADMYTIYIYTNNFLQ